MKLVKRVLSKIELEHVLAIIVAIQVVVTAAAVYKIYKSRRLVVSSAPEVPKECMWRSEPPFVTLRWFEVEPMQGEDMTRMICDGRWPFDPQTSCDTYSMLNSHRFLEDVLWYEDRIGRRAPMGSETDCDFEPPFTLQEVVTCKAELHDPDDVVRENVVFVCMGDVLCDDPRDCCSIVSTENVPYNPPRVPLESDISNFREETCRNLAIRKEKCSTPCSDPRNSEKCAEWWNFECVDGRLP